MIPLRQWYHLIILGQKYISLVESDDCLALDVAVLPIAAGCVMTFHFLIYLKNILFSGRRKRWQSTWQAMLKSSEAWAPRHRFCLNHSMFRYFKSVWLLFWLPGVRATSNCWRSLSGHGPSIPWVALSFFGIDKLGRLPKPLATEQSSVPLQRKGGSLKSILSRP